MRGRSEKTTPSHIHTPVLLLLLFLLLLTPVGCKAEQTRPTPLPAQSVEEPLPLDVDSPAPTPKTQITGEESPLPTPAVPAAIPPEAGRLVELAKEELAAKISVAAADVVVVSVEPVEWPDTSLGCPEPGMMYAQVLTPGFLIVLEANGSIFEYHSDTAQTVVSCQ